VTFRDGRATTGRVAGSDEHRAVLDVDGINEEVAYDEVARAKVQIEFNRKES
jgi:ribosome maturation factor RimP